MSIDRVGGIQRLRLSRRRFTASAAALAAAPRLFAQSSAISLRKLNYFEIRVSNLDASLRFYQDLFGMPVQARRPGSLCLRIGDGPQFMRLREARRDETPAITHFGYSVADYDTQRVLAQLGAAGFERIEPPPETAAGIDHAMTTWVRRVAQAEELYFSDASGLVVRLSDPAYCGGAGRAGDDCGPVEPAPDGRMRLHDLNHFTVFVNDGAAANAFYQQTFGLPVQAYQGPRAPVTGIGDGYQFVMYVGPPREQRVPATIHHGCFSMPGFDVDRVLGLLSDHGLRPRGDGPLGPLMHYVSLRMPERGGAEGGTPELYFTDPDGILLQLQDLSYCGGGGYLGNECLV